MKLLSDCHFLQLFSIHFQYCGDQVSGVAGAGWMVGSSVGSVGSCARRYDTAITCLFIFWCHYHTHLHHNTLTFVTDITYPTLTQSSDTYTLQNKYFCVTG